MLITLGLALWLVVDVHPWASLAPAVGLSLLSYVAYFVVSFRVYTAPTPRVGGKPTAKPSEARALIARLESSLTQEAAEFYSQMIIDPPRYTIRITDRISPTSRAYDFVRSMKVGIPSTLAADRIPIPLDLVSKGNLMHKLHVQDQGGMTLSTLSQDATIAHSALVARKMVKRIRGGRYLKEYKDTIEVDVVSYLCRNEQVDVSTDPEFQDMAQRIVALASRQRDLVKLLIVVSYLQVLATHYPLVVYAKTGDASAGEELIAGEYLRMTISRRTIPVIGRDMTWWDTQRERVRSLFGIRPARITWSLVPALRARSYHLECLGPEGSYLARQSVYAHTATGDALLARLNHRLLARHGQRFSHLYIHDFRPLSNLGSAQNGSQLSYVASFYERPPGTTANAAISALTAAVLITIAAATRLQNVVGGNTDILAILLTVPVVASAWLGFGSGPSVFLGALGARLALLSTMVCSLGASALFLLGASAAVDRADPWWDRESAAMWVVLCTVIWFTFAAAGLSWTLRVFTYRAFIRREPIG
ncbi:hypothetical protein [Nocardioides currus]|uniref:Uncharacterized protein n=1 Tax=Nocardioides currus TaxID=2133958 RepID=A0A2R7YRH6_9ACTN|nr:hypothetical protein [Nocardioides currus]PUA78941.1 hypothetical protein C7S10_21810 [Nocardioides currus]